MFETRLENIIVASTLVILFLILGFIVFVIIYHKRYFRLVQEKIRQEESQNTILVETIIKSQEKERKRIGEDLHDDIIPILASTLMNLNTQLEITKDQDVTHAHNAIKYIENVMKKIRDTSHLLHPANLENYGLLRSLEDFAIMMNGSKGCNIEIHTILTKVPVDSFKQTMLYHMTKEIIINAIKHGKAKSFKISIYEKLDELNLIVFHDGGKFLRQDYLKGLQNVDALGLKYIQHRINLLSGKIWFKSDETLSEQSVHLNIPIGENNNH